MSIVKYSYLYGLVFISVVSVMKQKAATENTHSPPKSECGNAARVYHQGLTI